MEGGGARPPEAVTPKSERRPGAPLQAADSESPGDALRAELSAMSLRAATRRAEEMGVDDARLDATEAAIAELMTRQTPYTEGDEAGATPPRGKKQFWKKWKKPKTEDR